MNKLLLLIFFFILLISCNNEEKNTFSKVEIHENTFLFQNIKYKDTIKHRFLIKNISDIPLVINNVGSSCGCIISSFSKSPILKNKFAEINIIYTPQKGKKGKVNKTLLVKCNIDSTYIPLYIKGQIIE